MLASHATKRIFTKIHMLKHISPILTLFLALFFFASLNACSPDYPETVPPPTKIAQSQKEPIKPVVIAPAKPEIKPKPLADPEIEADPALLRVGVSPDAPPLISEKDTTMQGLEADLAQQLGTFSKKKVVFVKVSKKKANEALTKGHVDIIMSGLTIASEKDDDIIFSDPYLRTGQIMLVRSRDTALFSTGIYNLENSNFVIGVIEGSEGDRFVTKTMRKVKVMRLKTINAATEALTRKKIDIFLHDAPTICYLANSKSTLTPILTLVTEEFMGWKMRKEDEELRHQVNLFLRQSKESGQLQKTIKQCIPNL